MLITQKVVEKDNKRVAKALGVKIIKGRKADRYKVGIHLLNPTPYELADALDRVESDGWRTIYVYDKRSWK